MTTYPIGTRSESERLVQDWGFSSVFTWADRKCVPVYVIVEMLGCPFANVLAVKEMLITRLTRMAM